LGVFGRFSIAKRFFRFGGNIMNRKSAADRKSEKLSLRIRREQAERLKKYQKKNRLPSKGEAVRRLIDEGAGS
tara:strand:- start:237 stop:455 length:219 start_codon:yes stop_codon:yes gene_type:complete